MARPKKGYYAADGKRVPGVTTIIGRFKDSGGLIHWAWQQGSDGKDYRDTRDQAATAGHFAHDMIEAQIKKRPFKVPEGADPALLDMAERCLDTFVRWSEQTHLEIIETETPLVSELGRYGGTPDAIGKVSGRLVLLDWKSGNRVYPDYLVQVAAYVNLWEENHLGRIEGADLLRVDKEFAGFTHHSWERSVIDVGWDAFKLQLELYELDKKLKRAVG